MALREVALREVALSDKIDDCLARLRNCIVWTRKVITLMACFS